MDWSAYPHLSEHHRELAEALANGLGPQALAEALACPPEQQVARLEQFHAFVLQQRAKASERATAQTNELAVAVSKTQEQLAAVQAQNATLTRLVESLSSGAGKRRTAVKLDAPKFDGSDGNNLTHWLMAVQRAGIAQLIDDDQQMVSFALSNLRGKASEWAYSTLMADNDSFPTWAIFQEKIRTMYSPPNNIVLLQGKFFATRQGSRSLLTYVQEMRTLCAAMSDDPIPESIKVPAFLNGLKHGPPRQALFRNVPSTMEEAIQIALVEEQSFNSGTAPSRANGPSPMDLGNAEVVCYYCNKRGHVQSQCHKKQRDARDGNLKKGFRGNHAPKGGNGSAGSGSNAPFARRSGGAPASPKKENDKRQ